MCKSKFIEGIEEIVSISSINQNVLEGNEAQTRWLLIDTFILNCLGYRREDILVEYNIDSNDRVNVYDRLDYTILLNNKPKLLIEAKSLGIDLYSKIPQLYDYYKNIHITADYIRNELIGVLTDGDLYLFFTDSVEQGVMDTEPFYTIRLSCSEDIERLELLKYSKSYLLDNTMPILSNTIEYDLSEYYRIDRIESVFNYYSSLGVELSISNVQINGKYRKIKSFRGLYKEVLREVNILQPDLLYTLAEEEDNMKVVGSIVDSKFSLSYSSQNSFEIKTQQGFVYISFSRTRKGLIDRIVELLKQSNIGLFNVTVKVQNKNTASTLTIE